MCFPLLCVQQPHAAITGSYIYQNHCNALKSISKLPFWKICSFLAQKPVSLIMSLRADYKIIISFLSVVCYDGVTKRISVL